ncbi:MAG: GNAT family N-acetyltransferase [Alphaproteobacteria bacterium]|nr:GNAT family N-acetyltransferase [Alphaproteobacteria bacterium]
MVDFEICYLADKPEFTDACAAWAYGRWGVQKSDGSLVRAVSIFGKGVQKNRLPITMVVVNKKTKMPIGMGSLWDSDGDEWPDVTPFIAAVYVHYRYRGCGIGEAMVKRLEVEADRLGFSELYLKSGSAASYYTELGYKAIDSAKVETNAAGMETLFIKEFRDDKACC